MCILFWKTGKVLEKARKLAVCGRIKQLLILLDIDMLVHITTGGTRRTYM
jgi:hypothetical protein